jgi:hypothetical protein
VAVTVFYGDYLYGKGTQRYDDAKNQNQPLDIILNHFNPVFHIFFSKIKYNNMFLFLLSFPSKWLLSKRFFLPKLRSRLYV